MTAKFKQFKAWLFDSNKNSLMMILIYGFLVAIAFNFLAIILWRLPIHRLFDDLAMASVFVTVIVVGLIAVHISKLDKSEHKRDDKND